jgi:2-keto-3-deoxy-L-rhamnonate aldolase RhmA
VTPIVRVPANTSDWISRALDGGAAAVIVPHVNSVAEAENVVRYAKFAPLGERSATSGMAIQLGPGKVRQPGRQRRYRRHLHD